MTTSLSSFDLDQLVEKFPTRHIVDRRANSPFENFSYVAKTPSKNFRAVKPKDKLTTAELFFALGALYATVKVTPKTNRNRLSLCLKHEALIEILQNIIGGRGRSACRKSRNKVGVRNFYMPGINNLRKLKRKLTPAIRRQLPSQVVEFFDSAFESLAI